MKIGKILLFLFLGLFAFVLMLGGCVYSGYNKAVAMDEQVNSAWAQVENQLQRRFDLIPNIVSTVQGVTKQEKDVFLGIAKSRESYFQAKTTGAKVKAAGMFESALSRLLVLKESYPQLRSNENFLKLQDTVEGSENRLSVERKRYNDSVRVMNTFSRKLLGKLYCSLAGVEKSEYFEIAEEIKAVPKIDFNGEANDG